MNTAVRSIIKLRSRTEFYAECYEIHKRSHEFREERLRNQLYVDGARSFFGILCVK